MYKRQILDVLRDPNAQPINTWLASREIPAEVINLTEKSFLSLESQIVRARLRGLLSNYPAIAITDDGNTLAGELTQQQHHALSADLAQLPGVTDPQSLLAPIQISDKQTLELGAKDSAMTLIKLKISLINSTSVEFASNSTQLSPQAEQSLASLASHAKALLSLAGQAQLDVSFIIIGASDAKGSQSYNEVLSIKRAQTVRDTLQEYGLPSDKLNAIGIGIIDVPDAGNGARKVLFNVITTQASRSNG